MFGAKARNELIQIQLDELKNSVSDIIENQKKEIKECKLELTALRKEIETVRYDGNQVGKYKNEELS